MGREALPEIVEVEYHFRNSVHTFTSVNAAGLVHIDSTDREEAYNKIGPVLSRHFSASCGSPVRYSPNTDYAGFCDVVAGRDVAPMHNLAFRLETASVHC